MPLYFLMVDQVSSDPLLGRIAEHQTSVFVFCGSVNLTMTTEIKDLIGGDKEEIM